MPRRKINLPLIEVIGISLVVHVLAIVVLGGITIYTVLQNDEPEMEAPPDFKEIEPQKLQLQVKLQEQQKRSSKPTQRITVTNVSQLNVPQLDVDMPMVDTRVSVNVAAGGGMGRGFGTGGIDLTKSAVDFFGIRDTGENIALILDTARSMVEPERGDVAGYARVKAEIGRMISELSAGTMFNIYAFDDNLETFKSKPVAATAQNREEAEKWINRFWDFKNGKFNYQGARGFSVVPDMSDMPLQRHRVVRTGARDSPDAKFSLQELTGVQQQVGTGTSRMDLAILAAAEGGADAIFVITDGTPYVMREYTEKFIKDYQRRYDAFWKKAANDKAFQKWQDDMVAFRAKVRKYQEDRQKRGLPPEIREGGYPGGFKPPRPPKDIGHPPHYHNRLSTEQFIAMVTKRAREIYREKGRKMPPLHVVGYATGDKEEANMNTLQKPFRGGSKFRRITGTQLLERQTLGDT